MELLVLTNSWPLSDRHEFLDTEIVHLAGRFERVVVAPLRPRTTRTPQLPDGVEVDRTLADNLVRTRLNPARPSRLVTAAVRSVSRAAVGSGLRGADLLRDGTDPRWLAQFLLRRADSASVALWARSRPRLPDLAYTLWLGPATAGLRHAWPELPLVSRVHGGDLYQDRYGWRAIPYQAPAVHAVDRLAAVSEHGRDHLAALFPEAVGRIVVRRLGIPDVGGLGRTPSATGALRMLSVSSVDANKRVGLIAEVARVLAASRPVEWTHLGDGPQLGDVAHLLARRPASLTVDLRGQVTSADVYRELLEGRHHVVVNLSRSEGAPVSLMEAQCVGLPVVATDVGGSSEVAPRTLNEFVTTQDGPDRIAAAVLRAVQRPDSERKARREFWGRSFDAHRNYACWAAELRDLATRGRP